MEATFPQNHNDIIPWVHYTSKGKMQLSVCGNGSTIPIAITSMQSNLYYFSVAGLSSWRYYATNAT